ncbi:MAG: hypothetical protein DME87_00110 [Verrucomicrobia bacterium]|nr:MAG: hypothetical protein DME87_00110 [Verrucomicrobiota bacterium]
MPQSPYRIAAARFQSTLRGRLTLVGIKLLLRNETGSRDERSHFSKHGFAPQLLLFNDADEVSCRAGATKCSRCRASFAPIRSAFAGGIWFPRWTGYSAGPLSETKNWSKHLIESIYSQTGRS